MFELDLYSSINNLTQYAKFIALVLSALACKSEFDYFEAE